MIKTQRRKDWERICREIDEGAAVIGLAALFALCSCSTGPAVITTTTKAGHPVEIVTTGLSWLTKSKTVNSSVTLTKQDGTTLSLTHSTTGMNETSVPNTWLTTGMAIDLGAQQAGVETAKSADAVKTTKITEGAKVKITESNNAVEALKHAPEPLPIE